MFTRRGFFSFLAGGAASVLGAGWAGAMDSARQTACGATLRNYMATPLTIEVRNEILDSAWVDKALDARFAQSSFPPAKTIQWKRMERL